MSIIHYRKPIVLLLLINAGAILVTLLNLQPGLIRPLLGLLCAATFMLAGALLVAPHRS